MSGFYIRSGNIPSNLDFDEIFEGVQGNKTKIRFLEDGMVYFLSLLSIDNHSFVKSRDGYCRLNEKILSGIIGRTRPQKITSLLEMKGVIEVSPYSKGHFSKGYRLTEKYNTGEFKNLEFSVRIKSRLSNYQDQKVSDSQELEQEMYYIFQQFEKNKIHFDSDSAIKFVNKLGIELFHRTIVKSKRQRGFILKSLFNYIGKLVHQINDFNDPRSKKSISRTNHRFHSNITSLPKILRPFLLINGKKIGEIDISSSQPYILSTILNENFTTNESDGYNLHTINKDLYDHLQSLKKFTPSNIPGNNYYVLGVHLNKNSYDGINNFSNIDFSNDFYEQILVEGERRFPHNINEIKKIGKGRDFIKKHIMNFLFERNEDYRYDNRVITLLGHIYPEINEIIEQFIRFYGNSSFAILLQRIESYLILNNVCKQIHENFPDIPFYTIHDSILTTSENLDVVKNLMEETITGITGKILKTKIKRYDQPVEISEKLIDDCWFKINITTKKKYERVRYSFLQNNIDYGINLIVEPNEREFWIETMNREIQEVIGV